MRLKQFIPAGVFLTLILGSFSCERNNDNCTAGDGGDLTIVAYLKHHEKPIISRDTYRDSVFVKFNTQDAPGEDASDYDKIFVGQVGEDHVHLTGLKCGSYYLFATGFDTTIQQRVKGGVPFSTSQTSGEVEYTIPVTEVH